MPTTISSGSSAVDHGEQLRKTGVGGRTLDDRHRAGDTVPVGSETATPVRAEP